MVYSGGPLGEGNGSATTLSTVIFPESGFGRVFAHYEIIRRAPRNVAQSGIRRENWQFETLKIDA